MLAWIGKLLAGDLIKSEIEKLKEELVHAITFKKEAYIYLDGIMAEGQSMSKDKLDAWWIEQRAKLKAWAGQ